MEPPLESALMAAVERGALRVDGVPSPRPPALFDPATRTTGEGAAVLLRTLPTGTCICYDAPARRCAIHAQLGEAHLPSACRQFPRVVVADPRGVHVTLSHFCPTAAGLLFDDGLPCEEVILEPAAWQTRQLEGLDATIAMPPLLHPRLLSDCAAWDEWEGRAVALLLDEECGPDQALGRLAAAVETVRSWRPGGQPLVRRVAEAFGQVVEPRTVARAEVLRSARAATASLYPGLSWPAWPAMIRFVVPDALYPPVRRFLAAHAFANWAAYQGRGLRTWMRAVLAAGAVLGLEIARRVSDECPLDAVRLKEAIRASDRLLRHLVSPERFASELSACEGRPLALAAEEEGEPPWLN